MKKTNINKEENIIFYKLKSTGCGYGGDFFGLLFLFFCVIFFIHHSTLYSSSYCYLPTTCIVITTNKYILAMHYRTTI